MSRQIHDDIHFRVLRALETDSELSQRELARSLGISLGVVNFCLQGLVNKGQVKIGNFRASDNKLRYAYLLTPQGLATKARLTRAFLTRRIAEYEVLKAEIDALQGELTTSELNKRKAEER